MSGLLGGLGGPDVPSRALRVAVLGAGGTIAPAIIRDLAESPDEVVSIAALDVHRERAEAVCAAHGLGRAYAAAIDARDAQALQFAFDEVDVVVNAASYRINERVMDACEAAGVPAYFDLGGLYHVAAKQYARDADWAAAGHLAVLGCGAGPGKTNVMARMAVERLGGGPVDEIRCASSGADLDPPEGLSTPYAIETLIDELTLAPMAVRDGQAVALEPLADGGELVFPDPIGVRSSLYTLHSEVLTLPESFGARTVDFRLALAPAVLDGLRERIASGDNGGPRPVPPSGRTYSAQRVDVRAGDRTATVLALTVPHERWGIGGGVVSTGTVVSAIVRLYARRELEALAGVLAPERAVAPAALFAELEPRGCTIAFQ